MVAAQVKLAAVKVFFDRPVVHMTPVRGQPVAGVVLRVDWTVF
jgi:hypothetical protein